MIAGLTATAMAFRPCVCVCGHVWASKCATIHTEMRHLVFCVRQITVRQAVKDLDMLNMQLDLAVFFLIPDFMTTTDHPSD